MNTPSEIAPREPQQEALQTEPIPTAKRRGQIYSRILVGTDFSIASDVAFEQALKLAKLAKAELLIAHASCAPSYVSVMSPETLGQWEQLNHTEAEKNIGALIQKARQAGVHAHMLLLSGPADEAIIEASERLGVDLIVIGIHDRRGVSRFFLDSVAPHVVSRARCGVLTARAQGAGKSHG